MDQIGSLSITTSPDGSPVPVTGPLTLAELISQYPIPVTDDGTHTRLDSANASLDLIATYNSSIVSNTFDIKVSTDSINSKLDILTHIDSDLHTANTHLNQISVNTQSIYNQAVIAQGTYDAIAFHTQEINTNTDDIKTKLDTANIFLNGIDNKSQTIIGHVDGIEALLTTGNATASSTNTLVGNIASTLQTFSLKHNNNYGVATGALRTASQIGNVNGAADFGAGATTSQTLRVEANVSGIAGLATETTLQSILTQVTSINGNTDLVETLIGHSNTALATIIGHVDGLEALVTSTNSALATLNTKDFATQTTLAALNAKFNSLGQKTMTNSHPVVIASDQSTIPVSLANTQLFTRIKQKNFFDTEEVRYDIPATLASGFIYSGLAANGTATSTASWSIVRTSFDANGNPTRDQYRTGISWDNRAVGW